LEFENYERNAFQELTEQHHSSLFGQNFVKIKKTSKATLLGMYIPQTEVQDTLSTAFT
jgi:hypothetical protein